jgi:hypothetical protein
MSSFSTMTKLRSFFFDTNFLTGDADTAFLFFLSGMTSSKAFNSSVSYESIFFNSISRPYYLVAIDEGTLILLGLVMFDFL